MRESLLLVKLLCISFRQMQENLKELTKQKEKLLKDLGEQPKFSQIEHC